MTFWFSGKAGRSGTGADFCCGSGVACFCACSVAQKIVVQMNARNRETAKCREWIRFISGLSKLRANKNLTSKPLSTPYGQMRISPKCCYISFTNG